MPALERRVVTALFADLAGFTTLGDSLDPEDLRAVQDAYFDAARGTVERYGGVLEKYIGDAVVALFGVPRARDDDAERAVRAGLALVGAVEQLGAAVGLSASSLRVRVGVNTGEVLHGEEGPERGAATGDTVNVAARLQAAAEPGSVLVGEETALAVEAAIELDPPQELALKGKANTVRARRAAGIRPEPSREQAMGSLRAPLLGRDCELGLLRAAAGRYVVVAPPGVGKTRLVEEFARGLEATLVCRARLRPETRAPQAAVAQLVLSAGPGSEVLLRERLLECGTAPARAAVVAAEIAAVAWPGKGDSGERDRDALFAAWTEGLDALAGGRRVVWIVEDVHWAGGDLLVFLDRAGRGDRLVLTTSRPSLLELEPAWCDGAEVLLLPPLPVAEVGQLVRALVGGALPPALVERVAARADGNPLFVEELLRSWISAGVLSRNGDGWRLAVDQASVPLPTTVQAIYAAQIDDLPEAARAVTRNASVAGRRFPFAGLTALRVEDGSVGVDVLVRRALVSGPLADPLGDSFTFRHALLRDAAYAGLARRDRAQLHVSYARWMENVAGVHLSELAEVIGGHYASALENTPALAAEVADGLDRRAAGVTAAGWLERGAEAALSGAAHVTARELLRRSLELTPEDLVLDRSRRWRILAEATAGGADLDEAERAAQTALELARVAFRAAEPGAREVFAEAAAVVGRVLHEQLRFHDELQLANEMLAEVGDGDDRATALVLLLRAYGLEGVGAPFEERAAGLERAIELARRCGDARLEFQVRARRVLEEADLADSALDACADLARDGIALGEWRESVRALHTHAALLIDRAALDDAFAILDEAAELAQAHGLTELLAWNHYWRVEAGLISPDWDGAVASGLAALELAEQNAYHRAAVRTWFALVPIAGARGDRPLLERARAWFAGQGLSAAHAATISPYAHVMACGVELVLARAGLGEPPRPVAELCRSEIASSGGTSSLLAAVDELFALWAEIDQASLRAAVEERTSITPADRSPMLLSLGIDHLGLARVDRDLAHAREALRCFRDCGAAWWTAKTLRVLESLGDEEGPEAATIERGLGIPVGR